MNFVGKNFVFILAGSVIFLVVISYVYFQFFPPKNGQIPQIPIFRPPSATPTTSPSISSYNGIKQEITEDDKIKAAQQISVTNFSSKLPLTGKNFIISYDINTNTFYVQITGEPGSANQELDDLLKQNDIMDRSWIKHLIIK